MTRTVVITGTTTGLGRATVEKFTDEGWNVVATVRKPADMSIYDDQPNVKTLFLDVDDETAAATFVADAVAAFGRVDVLVNVVGGIASSTLYQPFLEISNERWLGTYELNIAGTRFLTRFLAPGMIQRQYGRIINIASTDFGGQVGHADYASSKAAVVSLTRVMAMEFAPHVCVNCIAPGLINTRAVRAIPPEKIQARIDSTLLKRMGEPIEVANTALFLGSEESSFITGEILCVSGGLWASL